MYSLRHTPCCLARVARRSLRHHYTRTSRMVAERMVAPRLSTAVYDVPRPHRGVLEGTSSTRMVVRWKLTRLSLMSCSQGWSISRMKWCSSATEATDTRTLGNPKMSQTTLRNGQHGSEIKAVLKRSSDLKKSKPVDGGNVSVEVGAHCAEGVQQFNIFATPDRYELKSIDSVIRHICPLEGTKQVNVPVSPESKLIGSPTTQKRNDVRVTDQNEAPSVRYRPVL